jgi:hypothetical protein
MHRILAIGAVIVVGAVFTVAVGGVLPPRWPDARFAAFLRAAAGGDQDRGWSFVSDLVGDLSYNNDRAAYLLDAAAADWAAFRWAEPETRWSDDGIASVEAELLSPPSTVPAFLIQNGIVHGICVDGGPTAIGVFALENPFARDFGAGGLTGSQKACNAQFIGDAEYADWLEP